MFENKTQPVEGPGTVVGTNVKLAGTLKDTNDITIHGQVEGEVISDKHVTIAHEAKVKGPIKAASVTISGSVMGEISASKSVEILETGNVNGSVETKTLVIKSGANFNGKSKMKTESQAISSIKNTETKKKNVTSDTNVKNEKKESTDKKDDDGDIFKSPSQNKYELE